MNVGVMVHTTSDTTLNFSWLVASKDCVVLRIDSQVSIFMSPETFDRLGEAGKAFAELNQLEVEEQRQEEVRDERYDDCPF